ncbi:MAG: hypothetical protein IJK01_06080 [Clostridia bacterium]|nr:hypothetical protein [Clostridia bacterium]
MRGYIVELRTDRNGKKYGLLSVDGNSTFYYFNQHDLVNCNIRQLAEGDPMDFEPIPNSGKGRWLTATVVRKANQVSNEYSRVNPGINPAARLDHFNSDERDIINRLAKVFYVTSGGEQFTINRSIYRYCLVKPTDSFLHTFHLARELVVIFSDYVSFEPRTLDAASHVYDTIREKLRLDRGCHILICHDNRIEDKLVGILKDNNLTQIIIPFTYEELLSDNADALFVESRFKKYLFDVDLFAEIKPIQNDIFFFGRRDFAHDIVSKCKNGTNSGVFGLRRSGKTSLLYAVQRLLKQQSYPTVFIPCESDLRDLDWKTALYKVVSDLYKDLELYLASPNQQCYATEASATLSFEEDMDNALAHFHLPITLIFDEIEAITFGVNQGEDSNNIWYDGTNFYAFWNTIKGYYSKHPNKICMLVAGTNPMINEEPTIGEKGLTNPMFGQLSASNQGAYLKPFSNEDTRNMVNTLGGYMGLTFDDYSVSKLTEDCGGHPYLMRLLCSHINRYIKEKQFTRPITVSRAIYDNTISDFERSRDAVNFYLMILDILMTKYPREYNALKVLALQGDTIIGQTMDQNSLSHLLGYGLVECNNNYAIRYDTIRNYLRGEFKFELMGLSIEQQKQEIFARNDTAEIQLRKVVKNTLQTMMGISRAKDAVIVSMSSNFAISDSDLNKARKLTYAQLFDPSINKMYLTCLCGIVLDNFQLFQNIFEGTAEQEVRGHFKKINDARRCADHAFTETAERWSEKDFYEYRNSMAWLETILKQYE